MIETPCIWKSDDGLDWTYWYTTCGEAFSFEVGVPDENHYRYCPGCGRAILLAPHIEEVEVDDMPVLSAPEEA